ncbi:adenylate/guanylate cyclase domain-containing protein [Nordella sp. HKS 07]|uniref:adenylate/guanylate cyclase domain-containing protein n=1 Tax=Nordella sp. HKS 07 TaxID=2712222 RepID=UPI0013E1ACCD|nr:adenylate/guanylate cyclase domain-containing protein [Nordella sp. HKS 07]QIG48993.1 adenylate/guanylate cyclase domain-containing protein [Nordella sp. HKS 07]
MAEGQVQRRLAAILSADVAGYSRLMEQDEAGTLAALKERRKDILDPLVAAHHGRIVKLMGDGVLVEFASAVNAVACAVELHKRMAAASDGLPEERRILLRIGINLGDVMVEGGDLYGDGVNIAARLEKLADPGGICVTGKVHDEVRRKLDLVFEDAGEQTLKNMTEPVRIYRSGGERGRAPATQQAPSPEKPSIAVLPFVNMSSDPDQEYFSDGITEDIITELSRFHSLFVIARNSSFQYRGKAVDMRRIGQELGVHYVVEGSVRRAGDRVRITAQLLECETGTHLWAERYDRALDDIFAVQEEITRAIVSGLPRMLGEAQIERKRRKPTDHLSAYDFVLRGEWHVSHGDATGNPQALAMFEQALAIDPDCARAHANIAYQYAYNVFLTGIRNDKVLQHARKHAERALALDDDDATAHEIAAFVYIMAGELELAESHAARGVMLNPNDRHAVGMRGTVANFLGDAQLGIEWLLRARRLDPRSFDAGREPLIEAYYASHQYAAAIDEFKQWRRPPAGMWLVAAACHAQLGRMDESRAALRRFETERPHEFNFAESVAAQVGMYKRQEDRDHWLDGYRKAGLPI